MAPTRTGEMKQPCVPCPQCDKTFSRKYDMTRHVKGIHDKIREPECPFAAAQKSALETHMNTHSGRRPNVCPECSITYRDPSSLSRHKKQQHGHIPHHTAAWHAKQSRKNARASPYDVSAPAARGTARAKRTAAASEASSSSASSGYSSSPSLSSSAGSDLSLPTPPPVSPGFDTLDFASFPASAPYDSSPSSFSSADSGLSLLTSPPLSSDFGTKDFSSFPTSPLAYSSSPTPSHPRLRLVALNGSPDMMKETSAFDFSSSISGDAPHDLAMPQCPSYVVRDAQYGYEVAPTDGDWAAFVQQQQESADYCGLQTPALSMQDYTGYPDNVNSQMSYDAGAFDPTWDLADGFASCDQQPQYPLPQSFYENTPMFQRHLTSTAALCPSGRPTLCLPSSSLALFRLTSSTCHLK
ncbi:hypothetical protein EWM64_g5031 [Hericium alpestre]|uniref:C2H2-type domain-containing protein n=1 Tax=Hericium alpestre TaxID=135208 RepID=A0A4Y9ZYG4_9AGAM|nr:hypothetical protein EWM64_g5031 [Hericium alpestre]